MTGEDGPRSAGADLRAAIAAVVLAPMVCIWVFRTEILHNSTDLASSALTFAGVGVLLAMVAWRAVFRRPGARAIILVYAAVACTAGIATMGMVQFLVTTLLAPFYFATPENRWSEFWASIPSWAAPRSPEAVRGFFLGGSSLYQADIWRQWLEPAALWGVFLAALLGAQYCIALLMYERWAKEERLAFPIVQLPLALTSPPADRRPFAAGILLAVAVQGLNAVHYLAPSAPKLNVLPTEVGALLPPPWNGMGQLWITYYPCIIGLSALIPANILFSCVLFFWIGKAEGVYGRAFGLTASGGGTGFPYATEQAQGALLALSLTVVWSARRSLLQSLRDARRRPLWLVLAACSLTLCCFGVAIGLRPISAVVFFLVFLLFMTAIGWLRAAIGPAWPPGADVSWWIRGLGGAMPPGEGIGLAYLRWFSFGDFRAHALPNYVDALRLAERSGVSRRTLTATLAGATALAIVASLWAALDVYYNHGAATALTHNWRTYQGRIAFDILRSHTDGLAVQPGASQLGAAGFGFALVIALQMIGARLTGWPLHPAGFALAQSGALEWLWCPMLIAGIAKVALLRGGLRTYRRSVPFFIGLALGDYGVGIVLAVLSSALNVSLYKTFPIE